MYLAVLIATDLTAQMVSVAMSWQMYTLTHAALDLGLIGLVQFAPMVLLTFVVGYVADHFNRKLIVSLFLGLEAVVFAVMAIGSGEGWITRGWILGMVFVLGMANAFLDTTMPALLANIVQKEHFAKQMAQTTSASQVAMMVGPAIGGLLYATGPATVYGLSGAICCAAALMMMRMRVQQQPVPREPVTLASVLAGLTFIRSNPVILGAISLDLFAVLFGGVTALLPIYASTILQVGAFGLGMLRSAPAIGAMLMSLFLSRRPIDYRVGPILFLSVFVYGVATLVFAVSTSFTLSLAALLTLGASDVISVVIRSTLVLSQTPDAMRGRVNSVNQVFIGTSNQLGAFESGLTAAWFGAIPAAIIGGLATIAVVVLWIKLFPPLFRVNQFQTNNHDHSLLDETLTNS